MGTAGACKGRLQRQSRLRREAALPASERAINSWRLPRWRFAARAEPSRLQLLRRLRRKIGQDAVGAGALEAEQAFHHRPLAVDPAIAGGGRDHRVFAGHLVDEGRHREGVLHPPHDVEIGHAGLHHHHVGALGDVEFDLAQRLVGIGAVHLVGALVAGQRLGRADGVAERAVEGGSIFRRIGHDLHVEEAGVVERLRGWRRRGRPSCPTAR